MEHLDEGMRQQLRDILVLIVTANDIDRLEQRIELVLKHVDTAIDEAVKQEREKSAELLECLEDMVNQHCTHGGLIDDGALSANFSAIETLLHYGRLMRVRQGKYKWPGRS